MIPSFLFTREDLGYSRCVMLFAPGTALYTFYRSLSAGILCVIYKYLYLLIYIIFSLLLSIGISYAYSTAISYHHGVSYDF